MIRCGRCRVYRAWARTTISKAGGYNRMGIFAEVIHVTNRRDPAIDGLSGFDARTGRARVLLTRTFPVLPSAGVVFDF